MTFEENFKLTLHELERNILKRSRNKKLKYKDFTIISNNCWGGMTYESYNLPKLTPTVGLFIMPKDYIKFLTNLKHYLNAELTFINPNDSKYVSYLKKVTEFGKYPIGILDDIEIIFLHYKNEEEARDKWTRRTKRVNFDRLIVKFNDQNLCEEEDIIAFTKLPYKNKILFTCKDLNIKSECIYHIKQRDLTEIHTSNEPILQTKVINVTEFINNLK